ncbi:Protein Y8A9A.2 [Aphelenchoides avenae]|nr:Protein Y8A9A.2 [Aphelenchus avenae]
MRTDHNPLYASTNTRHYCCLLRHMVSLDVDGLSCRQLWWLRSTNKDKKVHYQFHLPLHWAFVGVGALRHDALHLSQAVLLWHYKPPSLGTCTPATTKCCPTGGIWSDWGPRVNCTDTCGAYGTAVRLRTCLTAADGCACTGSPRKTVSCAFTPCTYPRNSCNTGYKPTPVSGKIRCVAFLRDEVWFLLESAADPEVRLKAIRMSVRDQCDSGGPEEVLQNGSMHIP